MLCKARLLKFELLIALRGVSCVQGSDRRRIFIDSGVSIANRPRAVKVNSILQDLPLNEYNAGRANLGN
jgi:hypothetical protein